MRLPNNPLKRPTEKLLPIVPSLPFQWKQGQHLFLSGDTGSGKTTLANVLLYHRKYTISLRSKDDDAPLPGARIRRAADMARHPDINRWVLYPEHGEQAAEFSRAMATVWKERGWTLYLDELYYLTTQLKDREHDIENRINMLLTQGRSKKITVFCGCQRPAWISLFAPSQATHLIAFRHNDIDLRRLRDVGNRAWADTIQSLRPYEFVWLHRPTRRMWRGYVQQLLKPERLARGYITIDSERARVAH
jgi:energy-coupling factor transporter ATP-binding protein EcfA2